MGGPAQYNLGRRTRQIRIKGTKMANSPTRIVPVYTQQ